MQRVSFVDHTADVRMIIEAASLDDLFRAAAEAMLGYIITNPEQILPRGSETIQIQADSLSELLVRWLNELIFLIETKHTVYRSFQVQINEKTLELSAQVQGEPLDPARHQVDHEIKAVTRHEAEVSSTPTGWFAQVILDI